VTPHSSSPATPGQRSTFAFVDESGDPNLDLSQEGVTTFYAVCAVLVDATDKDTLTARANALRKQHFGAGEMKSSSVSANHERRRAVLADLATLPLKFCALVSDKREVDRDSGLQYKKSFIKHIQGRLYRRLYRALTSLHVRADQHGRAPFMESFKTYLAERYQQELFDHEDFLFLDSRNEPLLQVADFIAGTLRAVYSGKAPREFLTVLQRQAIIIERWPPSPAFKDLTPGLESKDRFDHLVAEQSLLLVRRYITGHAFSDDPDIISQVAALRYLFYRYELDPRQYVPTQQLLDHVNADRDEPYAQHTFRLNVIAKLRSNGVIIASSNKGYKIPASTSDIDDFVDLVNGQAVPFLHRLALARTHLQLASTGEYDIVDKEKYPQLAACLQVLASASPPPDSSATQMTPPIPTESDDTPVPL
jgi:hypothetical protein